MENDIKNFAKELSVKFHNKISGKNLLESSMSEMVRQMVEHKLKSEGWEKQRS